MSSLSTLTLSVSSLLDLCSDSVRASPFLLSRAAHLLPLHLSHYLLFRAWSKGDTFAVQRIVETWPHPHLSFDFSSTNSLARRKARDSLDCVKSNVYLGGIPWIKLESGEDSLCSAVLAGLFGHVFHNTEAGPSLKSVELHTIPVHFESLYMLLRGKYPGTHPFDYLNSSDAVKCRRTRPRLPFNVPTFQQVKLYITLSLDDKKHVLKATNQIEYSWFQLCITHLDLSSCRLQQSECGLALRELNLSHLRYLLLRMNNLPAVPHITHPFTLQLIVVPPLEKLSHKLTLEGVFLFFNGRPHLLYDTSLVLSDYPIKSVTINGPMQITMSGVMHPVPEKYQSPDLQYLQLSTSIFNFVPLDYLVTCSQLRVLSILPGIGHLGSTYHGVCDVVRCISQLSNLAFLEWDSDMNLRTGDLLAFHHALTASMFSLDHCHIRFPFILLSTTDLENAQFSPIISVLARHLTDLEGDDSCSTFKFTLDGFGLREWLTSLRPDVCFRMKVDTHLSYFV